MHQSKSSIHPEAPLVVLRSIFQRYDTDHDGQLNEEEFGHTLDDLGVQDTVEHNALFALADSNNSKTVSFDDFLHLVQSNGFARILSSPKDYEFVISTYQAFQQYDQNGDGQITWDQFYYYLHSMGYSHQHTSQYWYYMNPEQNSVISFEGFWKGFKAQAEAVHRHQLQHALNHQIMNGGKKSSKFGARSKVSLRPSLLRTCSFDNGDQNNVFHVVKSHLKPTIPNKSSFQLKVGRVLADDDEGDEGDDIYAAPMKIQISEAEEEDMFQGFRRHVAAVPTMSISLSAAVLGPLRLPDVIQTPHSPLFALIQQQQQQPRAQQAKRISSLFALCGTLSIQNVACDSNESCTSNSLSLGYSPSPSTLQLSPLTPSSSRLSLPQFPSMAGSEISNIISSSSHSDSVSDELSDIEYNLNADKLRSKKTKKKKPKRVQSFSVRPRLQNDGNDSADVKIDRRSVLKPSLKRHKKSVKKKNET